MGHSCRNCYCNVHAEELAKGARDHSLKTGVCLLQNSIKMWSIFKHILRYNQTHNLRSKEEKPEID